MVEMLVVVAIVLVLAGLLVPAILKLIRKGQEAKSISNLRQASTAFLSYTADNGGGFPFDVMYSTAQNSLAPYLGLQGFSNPQKTSVLNCPVMQSKWPSTSSWRATFALNTYASRYTRPPGETDNKVQVERDINYPRLMQNVPQPSKMLLISNDIPSWAEGSPGFYAFSLSSFSVGDRAGKFPERYLFPGGTQPFSFLDGHIEMITAEQIKKWCKGEGWDKDSNLFWRGGYKP
jgi:type II secretory pathway pseudopilin PulG